MLERSWLTWRAIHSKQLPALESFHGHTERQSGFICWKSKRLMSHMPTNNYLMSTLYRYVRTSSHSWLLWSDGTTPTVVHCSILQQHEENKYEHNQPALSYTYKIMHIYYVYTLYNSSKFTRYTLIYTIVLLNMAITPSEQYPNMSIWRSSHIQIHARKVVTWQRFTFDLINLQ